MFKMAKYYVLVNLYRKARKNIMIITASLIMMVLLSYLFADLVSMEAYTGHLIIAKWMMNLLLLSIIVWNMRKMISISILPFGKEHKETIVDFKKENILKKAHLLSRCDLILNKYRNKK